MASIPSAKEIQRTLFNLNPNKSLGPDELTPCFYKGVWPVLGEEVTITISKFFYYHVMLTATNSTILTLIPKFPGATIIKDYRPISCCNTLYNAISKLLVTRLKPIIYRLILPNQKTFINGRLLLQNFLLASELVSDSHKDEGPKRLTLKVDISKAFDTRSWEFILDCLVNLHIFATYIK